ncbi:ATP-dependent zinc metalloprotease FtsH [Candidatus Bipolaricaulota bacterium]|nr:ATP-dependent zinc metalloprotease FtsH [Candidatus Bipolaricaulota bacterium]
MDKDTLKDLRNRNLRSTAIIAVIVILGLILVQSWLGVEREQNEVSYSLFRDMVAGGQITSVLVTANNRGVGTMLDGRTIVVQLPVDKALFEPLLLEHNVELLYEQPANRGWILSLVGMFFPIILLVAVWVYIMRKTQQGGGALSFGQSKAKLVHPETTDITFSDVAGIDEVREEVEEIIEYLKDQKRFSLLGAEIPKGILLVGAPGTGKTLLAKAIAGEAKVPFFFISGSDFVEMFVGVGAARVRDMFEKAKVSSPCIIFIDEIDAVGRKRGAGLGGGHDEREQTLNQLLAEMDGFQPNKGIIMLAATNRPDVLDPALLRPGRFDRRITVPRPDIKGREEILNVHLQNKALAADIDPSVLARRTPGFVGADMRNLANEAALLAARSHKSLIEMVDFEEATDRIIAGVRRKGIVLSEEIRERIAYHESGHALLGRLLPKADPVHKISIIPRGDGSLGFTLQLPLEDKYIVSEEELNDKLTTLFGGRAAEQLVFNDLTTGAYDDLKQATKLAKRMVVEYGMSKKLGPISLARDHVDVFLGEEIVKSNEHSEELSSLVDSEIRLLISRTSQKAKSLLEQHRSVLDQLATALLENEIIAGTELDNLFDSLLPVPVAA